MYCESSPVRDVRLPHCNKTATKVAVWLNTEANKLLWLHVCDDCHFLHLLTIKTVSIDRWKELTCSTA